jgi:hypothetical protein
LVNLNAINENTVTDEEHGIVVTTITPISECPFTNTSKTMYRPESKRKRITDYYNVYAEFLPNYHGTDNNKRSYYQGYAFISIKTEILHELQRHILFQWWWEKYEVNKLKQELSILITHPFGSLGINNPLVINSPKELPNTALVPQGWTFNTIPFVFYGDSNDIQELVDNINVRRDNIKGIVASYDSQPYDVFDCSE